MNQTLGLNPTASPMPQPPKKRTRVTFSCLICRKRKMKCDRQLPCSTCKAANAAHLCRYDSRNPNAPQPNDTPIPNGSESAAPKVSKKPRGRPKKSVAELTKMHQQLVQQVEMGHQQHVPNNITNGQSTTPEVNSQNKNIDTPPKPRPSSISERGGIIMPPIGDTPSPSLSSPSASFISSSDMLHRVVVPRTAPETKYVGISANFSLCMKPARQQLFGPFSSMSFFSENEHLQRFSKQVHEAKKQNYIKDKDAPVLMRHKNKFVDLPKKYRARRCGGNGSFASPLDNPLPSINTPSSSSDFNDIPKSFPFDSPNGIYEMLELVPPKPLTYFLVDKFMNSVNRFFYTVIPKSFYECLDEFFIQKRRIMNREIPATVKTVDLRQVAQILLILRLARIALPFDWVVPEHLIAGDSDGESTPTTPTPSVADVYLGAGLMQIAENCLNHLGYLRKANLRVLQVLCLLKITAMCDPDAGDSADGCDSCNLSGLIMQISITMGLHMDPSHFSKVPPTIAHLWRMLFGFVVTLDAHRSLELALPPSLPLICSDTDVLFERHPLPDNLLSPGEEQHIYHRRKQLRWAFISLDVVRGLLRATVQVTPDGRGTCTQEMGKEYFDSIECKLEAFEKDMNPYYEEIVSALQAPEPRDSDYRTVDGHAAAQRLSLYMTLLRLRLGYYLCAGNHMDAADVQAKVVTCALKMCDVMQASMERPHLFSGFMWYVYFVNLRSFPFAFGTCISAYLNEINSRRAGDVPTVAPSSSAQYNDLTFDYSPEKIRDPRRLIHSAIRTHRWLRSLSQRYYVAWKCHAVVVGLLRGARLEVLAQHIDAQEYKRLQKKGQRDTTIVGPYVQEICKNDWEGDEPYGREPQASTPGNGGEGSIPLTPMVSQDQCQQQQQQLVTPQLQAQPQTEVQDQINWQNDNTLFHNSGMMEPSFINGPLIETPTFDTLGSTLGLPSLIAEEWANIEDSLFDDLNSSRFYMSVDQNFNNTSTSSDNLEVTSPSQILGFF